MNTHYVAMPVEHQRQLRIMYELVYSVIAFGSWREMAVVSHSYMPTKRMGYHPGRFPEVILQNRYTLNPDLVQFSITDLSHSDCETLDELFKHIEWGRNENDRNPRSVGRNYEEGVHNLFTDLQKSLIYLWRPWEKSHSGHTLTSDVHAYKWFKKSGEFLRLGTMRRDNTFEPGLAWQSEKLVRA